MNRISSILTTTSVTTLLCLSFFVALPGVADEAPPPLPKPSPRNGLTFDNDIKPLFGRSCTKCHGEEKQKAKLRLDSRDMALAGAKGEKVILPGKSAESILVLVVAKATDDEEEWMPPPDKAQELSPEEIGVIRAWIDQGAK